MSIVHEQYIRDLAANVFRGQEGAVLSELCVGDHCFGFKSVPIPGSEQTRRGRTVKPRKTYVVDPETAEWVKRIFHWFVQDRRSLCWIARELNRLAAPKDHRSTTTKWRSQYLPRLLRNRKYIGCWAWGQRANVRDPLTGKVRQEERSPEECEKWVRHFPHLQIIDNETFDRAQQLLDQNDAATAVSRSPEGKFKGARRGFSAQHPRHLLSGMVQCGHCGSTLNVGGSGGKYLFCPNYPMGLCDCQTKLRRDRAERMILDQIGDRIPANPAWRQAVLLETLAAWNSREAQIPSELAAAQKALAEVEQKIANLLDRIENGQGGSELEQRLAQRRAEKRELTEKVGGLQQADAQRKPLPTAAWVEERLHHLGDVLSGSRPAATHALRSLLGGRIVVTEIRQPGRKRHYLQGRFGIRVGATVQALLGHGGDPEAVPQEPGTLTEEIVIDFREPLEVIELSERAKALYDTGMMNAQIAKEMKLARNRVTAVLKYWFKSRGEEMLDGRARRASLKQKHLEPPLYQQIAEEVMVQFQQEKLLQDIANSLNVDRNTITAVIRWWHEVRGLAVPDGRTRRKGLDIKTTPKPDRTVTPPPDPSSDGQAESGG